MRHTFAQRLIETQEAERRRIARELHDEIGHALTMMKINF
jgi:signal transduction histidine kinase